MKRLLMWVCLLSGLTLSHAQISYQATYLAATGNPGNLNQESDNTFTGWVTILNGGLLANQWSGKKSLPFTFSFFGQSFSEYKVSANGLLTFSTSSALLPDDNQTIPTGVLPNYTIAAYWEKFTNFAPTGTNDQVMVKTFGQAPNRQFWIRWTSFEWGPTSFATLAIVLEESTNRVYMVDMYNSLTANWVTATVGVQENAQFGVQSGTNQLTLDGRTANFTDNSYYTFEPYVIPPEDLQPTRFISPVTSGCGLGLETISVKVSNLGQLDATQASISFQVDNGPVNTTSISGAVPAGDSITFTFPQLADLSAPGTHTLTVWTNGNDDQNSSNDTLRRFFTTIQEISTFPYLENFENGPGDWEASGENSTWEWATPVGPIILGATSGLKTWITNDNGSHAAFEKSYLTSPCFNLSNAGNDIWVSFQLWWETDAPWDGLSLQGSTDGGNTWTLIGSSSDPNWYNSAFIASLPGGTGQGWSGSQAQSSGSDGWQKVYVQLPSNLLNQSGVRFRFAFASNGATQKDGVAIDDFAVGTPPVFALGASGFYCAGDTLRVSKSNVTHEWSTGSQDDYIVLQPTNSQPLIDSVISLTLTDQAGLVRTKSITVSVDLPFTLALNQITGVACAGESTGTITVNRTGGSTVAVFSWDNGANTLNLSQAPADTFQLIGIDANGCTDTLSQLIIPENDPIYLNGIVADAVCAGEANGSIQLNLEGGIGPYTTTWAHGPTGDNLAGLVANTYVATITDQLGCEVDSTFTLSEPAPLAKGDVIQTDAQCIDSQNGYINLDMQGGNAPYTYIWTDTLGNTFTDSLLPGVYEVIVTDSLGCTWQDSNYVVSYTDSVPTAGFEVIVVDPWIELVDTSKGAATYLWEFGDGSTSTDTNKVRYHYPGNGVYVITQTVTNACGSSSIVDTINILRVNIETPPITDSWTIYPQPASDFFHIQASNTQQEEVLLRLLTIQGQEVLQKTYAPLAMGATQEISLSNLHPGIYILSLSTATQQFSHKVIVE